MSRATDAPIFVVGVSRSGTTLLAAMLGAHPRLSCGPETHVFDRLDVSTVGRVCSSRYWPDRAVEFLCNIKLDGRSVVDRYGVPPEDIRRYLESHGPKPRSIASVLSECFMLRAGKARWVEKTPRHMLHVETIRELFPESPIVRIVRDPRDVALSLMKRTFGPRSLVDGLLYWREFDDRSSRFFEADNLTHTLRYEDLVVSPEAELRRLCKFLGECFDPAMLDHTRSYDQVVQPDEVWKKDVARPLDHNRLRVWQRELREEERVQAELLVGDRLIAYSYPAADPAECYLHVMPLNRALLRFWDALKPLISRKVRLWARHRRERPLAHLYCGNPDEDFRLGSRSVERAQVTLDLLGGLVTARRGGVPILWLRRPASSNGRGYCARGIEWLLNRCAVSYDPMSSGRLTADLAGILLRGEGA